MPRPLIRIERGEPTDEELAALTTVLTARIRVVVDAARPSPPGNRLTRWRRPERRTGYLGPDRWH